MSASNCFFLTCLQFSQETGDVVCYSRLIKTVPQFAVIHTVKGLSIVNEAEVDAFLKFLCFFHDPADVGNLISGSSAFSKTSLNIWNFTVHVFLKPGLENFKHYWSYPTPLSLRPGAVAKRTNPTSKEPWLRRRRRA